MDLEELWQELKSVLGKQERSEKNQNEYIVFTKLKQRRRNRIQIYDDHLMRLSDGSNSTLQKISKEEIFTVAKWAIDAPDHRYSISDPNLKPARRGSIICTMLALLPDFDYLPGQVLVYRKPRS